MTFPRRLTNPAIWLLLVLTAVTVLVYRPGLSGDYMFDDLTNLLENHQLDMATLDSDTLLGAAFSSSSGELRRPVSMASFALNRYFFGVSPYSFKLANLAIHLLTGFLLYLLGNLLARACQVTGVQTVSAQTARWLPVLVAGLWLVHPLNLSSVLYIVQRMTSLAALFTVAGTCLYVAGRLRRLEGKSGMPHILVGLLGCGTLAVLSKENGVLLPVYLLVIEATVFRFRSSSGTQDRTITRFFLLVIGLPTLLTIALLVLEPNRLINYSGREFTLGERLLTEARVLVFYLQMIVAPSINQLGLYHDDIALSHGLFDPPTTAAALLLLAGLLATALLLPARYALVRLGILWFFAGHLLESTIIALEIAHEHRNYLADYGILLASVSLLGQVRTEQLGQLIRIGLPVLFIGVLSWTTWLRAGQWSDNISHAISEAEHHPQSTRAVFSAGRIYAKLALMKTPDSEAQAFHYLERARQLDHSGIMPDVTLLMLRYYLGKPVSEDSFHGIRQKLGRSPASAADVSSLKMLVDCRGGRCSIPTNEMDEMFDLALAHNQSSQLLTIYGFYRINTHHDFNGGLQIFRDIVQRFPRENQHWINLVTLLLVMERYDDANEQIEQLRKTNTFGGNEATIAQLTGEVEIARRVNAETKTPASASGDTP